MKFLQKLEDMGNKDSKESIEMTSKRGMGKQKSKKEKNGDSSENKQTKKNLVHDLEGDINLDDNQPSLEHES